MQKITRTFVRTQEMMNKYMEYSQSKNQNEKPFENINNTTIATFNNWIIIENRFPYDAIASTSHMLITKREVPFDWKLLTKEELDELTYLKETYINEHYDILWENLSKGRTIPGWFHLHILVLKREEI